LFIRRADSLILPALLFSVVLLVFVASAAGYRWTTASGAPISEDRLLKRILSVKTASNGSYEAIKGTVGALSEFVYIYFVFHNGTHCPIQIKSKM
jgi:hypothetical protein